MKRMCGSKEGAAYDREPGRETEIVQFESQDRP